MKNIIKQIETDFEAMKENYIHLHSNAETGFQLQKTVEYVKKKLEEYGCEAHDCGNCGIITEIGDKSKGKTVLLRADMDALSIKEETELPFAAENGNMHACGHDMHTAMLLCAAKLLKMHESELCGSVFLMFQPAEETLSGAKDMIDAGVLDETRADAALMLHVFSGADIGVGKIVIPPGGVSAPAADHFEMKLKGKACHGAAPQNGRDALLTACHTAVALQGICARETSAREGAVLTVGSMRAGSAANAVAGEAVLSGTMRAFSAESRERLKKALADTVNGIADAFGTHAEVCFTGGCPALINDAALCEKLREYCTELLGAEAVADAALLGGAGGSEDFAYIAERVPAASLLLCAGANEYPLHHPKVVFDESAVPTGAAVYAYAAMRWSAE
jgi:hippurate hydrolase